MLDRKRVHNLKYYTWVEQQARDVKDLNALWYDTKNTWDAVHAQAKDLDDLINEFNEATGFAQGPVRRHGAGALPPHLVLCFDCAGPAHLARCGADSRFAGRVGMQHFHPITATLVDGLWGLRPHTRPTFPSWEK